MKNITPILKYFGIFIVVYAALFALFSMQPVATATNSAYRAITAPVLQAIFPKAYLKLEKDAPPELDINTVRTVFTSKKKIEESKARARQQGSSKIDLKAKEYDIYLNLLFTSFWLFLISLILITPISIKQKLAGILVGTLLFYAYSVFKISIFLLDLFNRSELQMYKLGETGSAIAEGLSYVLKSLGLSAFIVVIIWVFVAFRKSNWKGILMNG
ncbi:MAG TPA: hypothetical protein ENJ95_20890 [Bacteroidetes bacterium]|nr:hypothetical protein [Bacteroidota bacterium]